MLCTIGTYELADGTLAGGRSLTGLRLKMVRVFDIIVPIGVQTSGNLVVGMLYKIAAYFAPDDFSNVGATNATGSIFVATGTTPTSWSQHSILNVLSPGLIDRNKRRVEITFSVQRVQDTIADAENFCLEHEQEVPRTGDIKLLANEGIISEALSALVVNGTLLSHELVRQIGKFTEHSYHVVGSPLFAPTPGADHLVTEGGDRITTEDGDALIVE